MRHCFWWNHLSATICDAIYSCEDFASAFRIFAATCMTGDPVYILQDAPVEIQELRFTQGVLLVPAVFQSGEQAIQQFSADPASVSATQTPTLQFDRADGLPASSTTFTLSAAGVVQSSASSLFDATGSVVQGSVQANYTSSGLVGSQDATLDNADGSVASSYNSANLSDGASITVQTVFNPSGLVVNQDLAVLAMRTAPFLST